MIKTILVAAGGSETDEAVFAAALAVARPFSAHLNFLHVRLDATAMAITMSSEGGASPLAGGLVERLEEAADLREQQARALFDRFCAGHSLAIANAPPGPAGPSASWLREVGPEQLLLSEHGRAADLIVVGRPADADGASFANIETALIGSGRPVLIPPATTMTTLPETIVIGWKATREAAHAVTAAAALFAHVKRVRIVTVAEEEDLSSEEGSQLTANLRWRGIEVSAERLRPDQHGAADTLIHAATEAGALLVMGGYGRGRLHEWIFGGFTRHVLRSALAVPVFIVH
jgi:nucleotide-binding universal stress UspA family protein